MILECMARRPTEDVAAVGLHGGNLALSGDLDVLDSAAANGVRLGSGSSADDAGGGDEGGDDAGELHVGG